MAEFKPISPPITIRDYIGNYHAVYGWVPGTPTSPNIIPVVGNPDGPGIGPWHQFYGEDPWYAAPHAIV